MKFLMTTVLLFSILMFSGCGGSDDGGSEKGLNSTSSNNKGLAPVDDTEDTPALDEEGNTEIDSSNDDNTLAGGDTAMGGDTSIQIMKIFQVINNLTISIKQRSMILKKRHTLLMFCMKSTMQMIT